MKHNHVNGFYILLLTLSLLLYAGCSQSGGGAIPDDFRFGSQGLELRFHQSNQNVFFHGDDAVFLLEVFNRGTFPAQSTQFGRLFVSGFDRTYADLRLDNEFITIQGKSQFDPRGDHPQTYTIRTSRPLTTPLNVDSLRQSLMVTACYYYETHATAEICVDPDPHGRRVSSKVCNLGARNFGAQGHPIVITGIEPRVGRDNLMLTIRFSNSGGGQVYDFRSTQMNCAGGLNHQDLGVIVLRHASLGNMPLTCEPLGDIRLLGNSGSIVCQTPPGSIRSDQSAYWTNLDLEFGYGYKTSIQTEFRIYSD